MKARSGGLRVWVQLYRPIGSSSRPMVKEVSLDPKLQKNKQQLGYRLLVSVLWSPLPFLFRSLTFEWNSHSSFIVFYLQLPVLELRSLSFVLSQILKSTSCSFHSFQQQLCSCMPGLYSSQQPFQSFFGRCQFLLRVVRGLGFASVLQLIAWFDSDFGVDLPCVASEPLRQQLIRILTSFILDIRPYLLEQETSKARKPTREER